MKNVYTFGGAFDLFGGLSPPSTPQSTPRRWGLLCDNHASVATIQISVFDAQIQYVKIIRLCFHATQNI
jgi:hypothetical protein